MLWGVCSGSQTSAAALQEAVLPYIVISGPSGSLSSLTGSPPFHTAPGINPDTDQQGALLGLALSTVLCVTMMLVGVSLLLLLWLAVAVDGFSGKALLVSMDGFRWDYIKNISGLGNFSRMAKTGVSVDYVNNVFVTKTFPTHYSIVTGLYAESHGIVANTMYDRVRNATFKKWSKEPFWWDGGEPVWITAEKQNKKAGTYFWVGSETEIHHERPSIYKAYEDDVPFSTRIQTALSWFRDEGVDLVTLYFHEPDATGHIYGPFAEELKEKVREMDGILGQILDTLDEKHLSDVVNVIVTSDHGMTSVDMENRLLDLWSFIDDRSLVRKVVDSGAVTAILPVDGKEPELLTKLKRIPHVSVYRKEDIPDHFHYRNNPRIMPIIILADEGWLLTDRSGAVWKSRWPSWSPRP